MGEREATAMAEILSPQPAKFAPAGAVLREPGIQPAERAITAEPDLASLEGGAAARKACTLSPRWIRKYHKSTELPFRPFIRLVKEITDFFLEKVPNTKRVSSWTTLAVVSFQEGELDLVVRPAEAERR